MGVPVDMLVCPAPCSNLFLHFFFIGTGLSGRASSRQSQRCCHSKLPFACSHFQGGELWTEAAQGQYPLLHQGRILHGDALPLSYGQPVFFNARALLHCVLPWKGRRTILICFSVRDSTRVSTPDFQAAALHGFPLPASAEQSEPVPDPARAPGPATRARAPPSTPPGLVRPPGFIRGSAVPASPPSGPWLWEVFSGSARLSLTAAKAGFQVLPVDYQHTRHTPCLPSLLLDLSQTSAQDHLMSLWEVQRPCFVHIGLPCGTSSRARERPLPSALRHHAAPQPSPLRSQGQPLGLPGLQGRDLVKVQRANSLARLCIRLIFKAWETQHSVCCRKPSPRPHMGLAAGLGA